MEPWEISGPQFIGLYIGGVVVAFLLGFVLRKVMWPRERPTGPVTVEEVAFMRGGPFRVVDVAIAQLLQTGAVRVDRSGTLHATGIAGRTSLEQAILQSLRRGRGNARIVKLLLRRHPAIRAIRSSLANRGLIQANTFAQVSVMNLPILVVFGIGIARLVNGIRLSRPVDLLWACLIVTFGLLLARWFSAGKVKETPAGAEFRRGLRSFAENAHLRMPVAALTGVAGIVALGGLAAFPDATISVALASTDPMRWGFGGSSSSSSSSDSSSSSSSCSSGSSCGGGGSSCGG
ncbi:TIGR04222 domain-containing membrane protein [Kibdelosporangium aridum]|uniref:TIGR04222 domain-containing protein n=1 Tax=Kibdelosporangium aridum TaxID=2030 RepID=A0A1W2F367_KIBAR|nr:TIGR04222 domain-containing membrane protein [Kibdelosporangium aridum]SMD16390.1 TIGR04222 domain-containing protein [Kibdelosporangium aridum]